MDDERGSVEKSKAFEELDRPASWRLPSLNPRSDPAQNGWPGAGAKLEKLHFACGLAHMNTRDAYGRAIELVANCAKHLRRNGITGVWRNRHSDNVAADPPRRIARAARLIDTLAVRQVEPEELVEHDGVQPRVFERSHGGKGVADVANGSD